MLLLVGQVPRAFRGREAWQELDYGDVFGVSRRRHGRSIPSTAFPSTWPRRSRSRCPAGPGRSCSRSRRTSPRSPPPPMPIRSRPSRSCPRRRISSGCRTCSPAPSAARRRGRGRLDRRDEPRCPGVLRGERASGGVRVSLPDFVDNRSPSYVGVLGVAMDEAIAGRLATPISCSRSAAASARCPAPLRSSRRRIRSRRSSMRTRTRVSSAVSISRISHSPRRFPRWPPPCARSIRWRASGASGRTRRARLRAESRAQADGRRRRPRRDHGLPSPPASRRRRPDLRAGNFTVWAHRFAQFTQFGTQACPRSGRWDTGSQRWRRSSSIRRVVVCFTGDGDFVMSSPELATAVQYELPIVVLLVNNGMYATIRMHQERSSRAV